MILPDFDNSLLNLTASISLCYGCSPSYKPLTRLSLDGLKSKKNVILMVIDGLGYNFFKENVSNQLLINGDLGAITSVFPSTTAVAITSILTGKSPHEHALTGWFVYLKELGSVSKILPLAPRYSDSLYFNNDEESNDVYGFDSLIDNFKVDSHFIHLNKYQNDAYQKLLRGKSHFHGFDNISEMATQVNKVVSSTESSKKFIYAYWNGLDAISHTYGYNSPEACQHFTDIQEQIIEVAQTINTQDTALIVTADHGFINVPDDHKFRVKDIPGLRECLVLPLMGEPRSPYCYLRSGKEKQFIETWEKYLSSYSQLFHIDELLEKQVFGLNDKHNKFSDRVGDYVIVMNDSYVLIDNVLLEKEMDLVGYHGGLTQNEMLVPLIYVG